MNPSFNKFIDIFRHCLPTQCAWHRHVMWIIACSDSRMRAQIDACENQNSICLPAAGFLLALYK